MNPISEDPPEGVDALVHSGANPCENCKYRVDQYEIMNTTGVCDFILWFLDFTNILL